MSITILLPIISGFCFRSGGVSKNDRFLPFMKPSTPWANKWWRWGMGLPISIVMLITGHGLFSMVYIFTYFVVTNVFAYGENSWMTKIFGGYRWFLYGALLGAASLSWGLSLWLGCVVAIAKKFDIDQAWLEFGMGMSSTLWLCFIK